jgi:hypothetical protein
VARSGEAHGAFGQRDSRLAAQRFVDLQEQRGAGDLDGEGGGGFDAVRREIVGCGECPAAAVENADAEPERSGARDVAPRFCPSQRNPTRRSMMHPFRGVLAVRR